MEFQSFLVGVADHPQPTDAELMAMFDQLSFGEKMAKLGLK